MHAYPVSREWLALHVRWMDAVAAVYRLAASLYPDVGGLRSHAEFHRRGRIDAAITLTRRVARLGGVSGIKRVGAGTTPADAGGPFAPLDAAALESSAADLERGGLPTWEARRLASVILGQVLHLADGALPVTREGIPRPAPAGSSPLSDRIGPAGRSPLDKRYRQGASGHLLTTESPA